MKYNDGVQMNEDMRVVICPKCRNNEFGDESAYCRICGQMLYNECEGGDYNDGAYEHRNPSNARFCEICGAETRFLKDKLLRPWNELPKDKNGNVITAPFGSSALEIAELPTDDDDELPF